MTRSAPFDDDATVAEVIWYLTTFEVTEETPNADKAKALEYLRSLPPGDRARDHGIEMEHVEDEGPIGGGP